METLFISMMIIIGWISGCSSVFFTNDRKGIFETPANLILVIATGTFFGGIGLGLLRLASLWF